MRAKRARLGASDHPFDERRAVMRLRLANKLKERDAYLAAHAVYTVGCVVFSSKPAKSQTLMITEGADGQKLRASTSVFAG